MVSYKAEDEETVHAGRSVVEPDLYADHYFAVDPLDACTNYTFYVSAVSPSGSQGSTETTRTATDEVGK